MLPFLFSAMTMRAVGRAAQKIVVEVRRQFKEIKGLIDGKAEADYETCVDICTKSSLKEMIFPAALGILAPIIVGLVLGCNGVVGMLAGALISGFALAVMMANSGGAWDNAKKYIEAGNFGGKGSENHKAAVVGDTVGDPFKDTSGPSVNILIKLLSMVSIVFAALIATYGGMGLF
jgi:K(+)-stimulated pyrophosphate-energized sodium pump